MWYSTTKYITFSRFLTEKNWRHDSGVTRLQWARVQVCQKGPLFPKKTFKKQRRTNFGPPTALGPRALHALHALLLRHCDTN